MLDGEYIKIKIDTCAQDVPGSVGKPVTKTERALYWMLKQANGRVVTYDALWDGLYALKPECEWPDDSILKTFISHLRRKVPGVQIKTHFGLGYSMECPMLERAE